jgi:hypothetical protein
MNGKMSFGSLQCAWLSDSLCVCFRRDEETLGLAFSSTIIWDLQLVLFFHCTLENELSEQDQLSWNARILLLLWWRDVLAMYHL